MKLADGRYDRYQRMLQGWLDEVYDKGYKQGIKDGNIKEAYQNGLEDAWDLVKKIFKMTGTDVKEIFGDFLIHHIMSQYTASEALQKIREYEEKQTCDICYYRDKLDAKCLFCDKLPSSEIKTGDDILIYRGDGVWIKKEG